MLMLTALLSLTLTAPKLDDRLLGTWLAGGAPFITLEATGQGSMEEGKVKWSADGKTLIVTDTDNATDTLAYTVNGNSLTLVMGGLPLTLTRAAAGASVKAPGPLSKKAAKATQVTEEEADREAMAQAQAYLAQQQHGGQVAPAPAQAGRAAPQPARAAGTSPLTQLMLSSAWCSFSYNKISGASSTTRFQFFRDGTWSNGGRAESYNSGANGSYAGQTDSANRGRWEVRDEQLYMSSPQNPQLQLVQGSMTRNSSGSPIITTGGREYSACN
jgi:hypothetical protein